MPHYKDGTEAKLSDEVIGQGCNVKHPITGVVVGITKGATTCNLIVAHAKSRVIQTHGAKTGQFEDGIHYPTIELEYGQADAFERVDLYEKRVG